MIEVSAGAETPTLAGPLARKGEGPEKSAEILCVPLGKAGSVNLAFPVASTGTVPSVTISGWGPKALKGKSWNVTVPVGVSAPPSEVTVAVSVTGSPALTRLAEAASSIDVGWNTVYCVPPAVLLSQPALPTKSAARG